MKLTKEKKQNLMLTIILTIGMIYGAWYLGVETQGTKEKRDTNERDRLADEIKKTENANLREKNNREQAKVFQNYIHVAEEKMPKGTVDAWLLKELSDIAARHNVTLGNSILQPVRELGDFKMKGQPYVLEGFHIDFKGEFNQIGSFIQEMENSMPMVEIHDISITSGSVVSGSEVAYIHSASMTICVVVRKT
jgi:Tfp pilus assembly protein PilO